MPVMDSEPKESFHYRTGIACPHCNGKMLVDIGLNGDPKHKLLACFGCGREFLPLVAGQIVGGPFPVTN